MINETVKNRKAYIYGRPRKKRQRQGAQRPRNEAYMRVCRNDEGCSATQYMDFLRGRHD